MQLLPTNRMPPLILIIFIFDFIFTNQLHHPYLIRRRRRRRRY